MALYTIKGLNDTSFLLAGEEIVYGGKQGFTTIAGSIPILCNSFSSNTTSIVLSIPDLHLLLDDNANSHLLEKAQELSGSEFSLTVPVTQYAISTFKEGSVGYKDSSAIASLPIIDYNVSANTVTVSTLSTTNPINSFFKSLPFYITINQAVNTENFANNTLYIKGSTKTIKNTFNVVGATASTFTANIPIYTRGKNQVKVFVDDNPQTSFTWQYTNSNTVIGVPLSGIESQITTEISKYTVPAIERNDSLVFSKSSNTYTVQNTSYDVLDEFYDADLTTAQVYKVKLSNPITSNVGGLKLINVSTDLVGSVGNIASNSFSIDFNDAYPYTYNLANNSIYYVYQKNKLRTTSARLDEFGKLVSANRGYYLVGATNVNRYNRTSPTTFGLLKVDPIKAGRVSSVSISEQIFIDTTGGASITATVSFPPITGGDITHYDVIYSIESEDDTVASSSRKITVDNDESAESITVNINNLNRGRTPGSNILVVSVVPKNGSYAGFAYNVSKPLIGKIIPPRGLENLNVGQQEDTLIFSWQFALTEDGFILDIDTKEVEIREYSGAIDTSDQSVVDAAWALSIPVERIPFPNTSFSLPVSKFGTYTYLLRVKDTSDLESETIAAATLETKRPNGIRLFKAYSEGSPDQNFAFQDGVAFPNSNVYAENSFPSVSMSINDGLVLSDSTHVDNANGSSIGFSFTNGSLTSLSSDRAVYTTQIRDLGVVARGTIRINTEVSIENPQTTFASQYSLIYEGISDDQSDSPSVLVDNAFSGLGHILGFSNSNAATVSYNTFHRTLVSGGALGNVYAIRNTGQFVGDEANTNAFCLIAGVINANAIALGESFHANGYPTGSNNFGNVTISGNTYELINFSQYGDLEGTLTYLGEERSIVQNVFVKYSADNVYYTAAANGVVGLPGHGNTNPFAFEGALNNASAGAKKYVSAELDARYFQIIFEVQNKRPSASSVLLDKLDYEFDIREKTITKTVEVNSVNGVEVNYAYAELLETPVVIASLLNSNTSFDTSVTNVSNIKCNVKVFNSQNGNAVDTETVSLYLRGI